MVYRRSARVEEIAKPWWERVNWSAYLPALLLAMSLVALGAVAQWIRAERAESERACVDYCAARGAVLWSSSGMGACACMESGRVTRHICQPERGICAEEP